MAEQLTQAEVPVEYDTKAADVQVEDAVLSSCVEAAAAEEEEGEEEEASDAEESDGSKENVINEISDVTYSQEIADARAKRLDFLLKKTQLYTHFVANGAKSKVTQNRKSKRPTEREPGLSQTQSATCSQHSDVTVQVSKKIENTPDYIKNGTMRDYQIDGLNWLISLHQNGLNGVLADEMGLGKTLQTISILGYLKHFEKISGPHLVIAPKSTLTNWTNEFKRWCPSLKTVCFIGYAEERLKLIRTVLRPQTRTWDVCITSYDVARLERHRLNKFRWQYVVIDEAHRIKNEKSQLSMIVRGFQSKDRLLLTGTPLQNNLHELWSILNFILPDVFNSSEDFDAWFNVNQLDVDTTVVTRLQAVLKPFLLRRLKAEVELNLPPKKEVKLFVSLSKMQKQWYRKILLKDFDEIKGGGSGGSMSRLMSMLMNLRKVCNHPYLFPGAEPGPPYTTASHLLKNSGKLFVLDKLLQKLKQQGSRVLIFSQMTRMLDIIEDYCDWRKYKHCRLDGQIKECQTREELIDDFNRPNSDKFVFLISTRAGGLGINLATADTVIIYDSDWNPQVDLQAMDRAHRIGQTKPVTVYRLITEETVEERVTQVAERKLCLDSMVIQHGLVAKSSHFNKKELIRAVCYGAQRVFASVDTEMEMDVDIDAILARSEKKATSQSELSVDEEIEKFTLVNDGYSVSKFEGEDYSLKRKIEEERRPVMPKRQRAAAVAASYALSANSRGHILPTPPEHPICYDFQFYPPRFLKLLQKEAKPIYSFALPLNGVVLSPTDRGRRSLTMEEQREKQDLLRSAFTDWTYKDYHSFVEGIKKFGRHNLPAIATYMKNKELEEVENYASVFWQRYREIFNWRHTMYEIEFAESRMRSVEEHYQCEVRTPGFLVVANPPEKRVLIDLSREQGQPIVIQLD